MLWLGLIIGIILGYILAAMMLASSKSEEVDKYYALKRKYHTLLHQKQKYPLEGAD